MLYFRKKLTAFFNTGKKKRLIHGLISTYDLFFKTQEKYMTHSENQWKAIKITII